MRRETAELIVQELLSCTGKLDHSLALIKDVTNEEFLSQYRRLVGQIMGGLYIDVLRELFLEHPDLEPDSMKS